MANHKKYYVYILVKNKLPIYVGCTSCLKSRLSKHKVTKDFDEHFILKEYTNKKEAFSAENSIIRFISVFGGEEWVNKKDVLLVFEGFYKGFNTEIKEVCHG
jgi:hypothetical protein